MAPLTNADLTDATLDGGGIFDLLMRAAKSHLEEEYTHNRLRGPEYAQVYLGTMQTVLQNAVQYALERDRATAQTALIDAQAQGEIKRSEEGGLIDQEILNMKAQVEKSEQEVINLGKAGEKLDAEVLLLPKTGEKLDAETALTVQQKTNLTSEALNIPKQGALLEAQKAESIAQGSKINQETTNLMTQETVLVAQECKLRAEYDMLLEQKLKAVAETSLLSQKKVTESAQTQGTIADTNSVIGTQRSLYEAQSMGYLRDAEQKAAKLLVDAWNIQRTTDEGISANSTNKLDDTNVGRVVGKLLSGVNA